MLEGPLVMIAALLLVLPTAYLLLVSTYLLVLTFGAWRYRPPAGTNASTLTIALLIPAHNEEDHLRDLIHSAQRLNYSREHYQVFVIADNCDDQTAAIARQEGADVFERHDPAQRGKGPALDWALRTQADTLEAFDIIALVDADMHIHADFLREIAASFSCPEIEVVQGLNTVARPGQNWRTALGFIGFSVINFLRPAGRCWLGGTGGLRGSGMAFRTPVLLRHGWPAHSLAEDIEFSKLLFLEGIQVHFNPRAVVTSEIPTQARQVQVQQQRWERGKLDLFKRYFGPTLRHCLRKPSFARLDAVLDLLVPPQSVLVLFYLLALGGSLLVHPIWTGLLLACVLADMLCIVSALLLARAPLRVWLYLGAVPLLLLWKIPIYVRLLVKRNSSTWQRTPRNREL